MPLSIDYFILNKGYANLSPLQIKRDWMDETYESHAYKCFPVTIANGLGWGLSFPEDITFIWDGISDSSSEHVKVLSGQKYVYTERANATISFKTGISFKTSRNLSLLQMPVPNLFLDGVQAFTTIISTSFFKGEFPCAWKITKPNIEITIKANTPVTALLPISLTEINNSEMNEVEYKNFKTDQLFENEYSKAIGDLNKQGKWSNFYRDGVDHKGNKIGFHEVKSIKLKVNRL